MVPVEAVNLEKSATLVTEVVGFDGKGGYNRVSELKICRYCQEESHTKFTCWKLPSKPTQPTRAAHLVPIQESSS